MQLSIIELAAHRDPRGEIFNIAAADLGFLGAARNLHFGTVTPRSVRGNHYHEQAKELLVVRFQDAWRFAWAASDCTEIQFRGFQQAGCVLIRIDTGIAHAVENLGVTDLSILSVTNRPYQPDDPDTFTRRLIG